MSDNVTNVEIPWFRKLQESTWLSSIGLGVKNTFIDEPSKGEELWMRRHHSEPKLPSSFASTDFGEERQWPSFLSSEVCEDNRLPSSFLSSDPMEGTKTLDADANEDMDCASQNNLTASSSEAAVNDDDLLNTCHSINLVVSSTELPEREMRKHSCTAFVTTQGGIALGENECTSENKSCSDSVLGNCNVSNNKGTLEGTPPLGEMPWDDTVTTVMIRQLPLQCTQPMLMSEINNRGFRNVFDFLYLPYDTKKGENVGYGFVNFHAPMYALACRDAFDGTYFPFLKRRKPLNVHPAQVQGYEANYNHFLMDKIGKKQPPPRFAPIFLPREGILSSNPINLKHSIASRTQKFQRNQEDQPMFCHMCGARQLIGFQFCRSCGTGLLVAGKF
jgi:hypothetical protein